MLRPIALRVLPLLLVVSTPAVAQDEAKGEEKKAEPKVLVEGTGRNGWWIAPTVQGTTIRDRGAVLPGLRGGWLLDGRFTIGLGGVGLANDIPAPAAAQAPGEELDLEMGYGGAWLEYTFAPLELVHVSVGALVGGGGLSLSWRGDGSHGSTDDFFVTEPAVMAEVNLARNVRVDLGVAWRWIVGVDMAGLSDSDVDGFSGIAIVKFGKF